MTDRRTNRLTDRPRYSICNNTLHLRSTTTMSRAINPDITRHNSLPRCWITGLLFCSYFRLRQAFPEENVSGYLEQLFTGCMSPNQQSKWCTEPNQPPHLVISEPQLASQGRQEAASTPATLHTRTHVNGISNCQKRLSIFSNSFLNNMHLNDLGCWNCAEYKTHSRNSEQAKCSRENVD